jgi:hypothetical protein
MTRFCKACEHEQVARRRLKDGRSRLREIDRHCITERRAC